MNAQVAAVQGVDGPGSVSEDVLSRFWAKVDVPEAEYGCWEWLAYRSTNGYGQFRYAGRYWQAHRFIYCALIESVSADLVMDHICENRACVRPSHLEPVTSKINTLRGNGLAAQQARQTHCLRGHELSGDNLYTEPGGRRKCRECMRERDRARYARKKQAAQFPGDDDA